MKDTFSPYNKPDDVVKPYDLDNDGYVEIFTGAQDTGRLDWFDLNGSSQGELGSCPSGSPFCIDTSTDDQPTNLSTLNDGDWQIVSWDVNATGAFGNNYTVYTTADGSSSSTENVYIQSDNRAPSISNLAAGPDPVDTGNTVNVSADITDDATLDQTLCTLKDADGNVEVDNVSMSTTPSGTFFCTYTTSDEDSDYGQWTADIWTNDTTGAVATGSTNFDVNTPPIPVTFSLNTTLLEPGDILESVASWTDKVGLSNTFLSHNESGTFQNQSVQSFSGSQIAVYREKNTNDIKYVTQSGNVVDTGVSGEVGGLGDLTGDGNNEIAAKTGYLTAGLDYVDLGISTSGNRRLGEICDVDGDGDQDMTYLNSNQKVSWVDADGNTGTSGVGPDGNAYIGGCGDIDNDGDIDVAYTDANSDFTSGNLSYVDKNGNKNTFNSIDTTGVGGVADFNGDGNQQIGYDDGHLKFVDADGNIEDTDTPLLPEPYGLSGDFDGDGDMDHTYWGTSGDRYLGIIDGENNTKKFTDTVPRRTGGAGTFADRSNANTTPSSTGLYGYRFWTNNTVGQWNRTETLTARVTNFPIQKNATLTWTGIGGSVTQEVEFGYTDPDGSEISSVASPPSGSVVATNSTATVTGWTSPFDWAATAIDQYGGESSVRNVNVTVTEHHVLVENATGTVNESRQTVNTSVTVDVRGDQMNYSVTAADPAVVTSTVRDDDQATVADAITGTKAFIWYWTVDHITSTTFPEYEDTTVSQTLSSQGVAKDKQLDNNNSIAYSGLTVTAPSLSGSCSNCDEREISVAGNTAVNETYNATGDFISSETKLTHLLKQNTSRASNTSQQWVWNQTALQVTNSKSFQFTAVDLSSQCDLTTSSTVGSGTVNATTACTNTTYGGDWLTDQEYDFSPQKDEVTLGVDYLGDRNLELANSKAVAFTGIDTTSAVTVPTACSQQNNTAVAVGSSATENYSVEMKCDPGSVSNAGLIKTLDATDDNQTKYNYTSDSVNITSNETRQTNVTWEIPKSELTDYIDRNNASAWFNDNTTGVTIDNQANTVRVTFTTDCCSSSPAKGVHQASLVYYVGEEDTTIEDSSSGSTGGSQRDTDLGAELLPSTPYLAGFDENVTRSLTVRNYKNVENSVDITIDPRPADACQYIRIQSVTKGRVEDSGRISRNLSGGFSTAGLVRIPPASAGLTGSSSEIPVPVQIRMPDETTFEQVKNENGTLSCRLTAAAGNGLVNDVVLEVEPQTNPFTGLFIRGNQFLTALVEWLLDTFTTTEQTCFGENNTALLVNDTAECPESAQETQPVPTPAGWVALIIGGAIVIAGLIRHYR